MGIDYRLDKTVKNFAVFGQPVRHSQSPLIHSLFAKQTKINLHYQSVEVPIDDFSDYLYAFFDQGGCGLNITLPFKEEAFRMSDVLTDRAKRAESVNTIWIKNHQIHGDTTDGQGLINDITCNQKIDVLHKEILILGAGGSVKALIEPLLNQQPTCITIANRHPGRAKQLAVKFAGDIPVTGCAYSALGRQTYDLIINATSLSLQSLIPPVPETLIHKKTCCYDLMYADQPTIFLQWAKDKGAAKISDGLGMLVEQAALGFSIWHGQTPKTNQIISKLKKW